MKTNILAKKGSRPNSNHLLGALLASLALASSLAAANTTTTTTTTTTEFPFDVEPEMGLEEDYDDEPAKDSLAEALKLSPVEYLVHFGYLPGASLVTEASFDRAVKLFQRFMGLPETGNVDETTVDAMKMERCANEDLLGDGKETLMSEKMRFSVQANKWRRPSLKYKISNYPKKYLRRRREINDVFAEAFGLWSKEIPVQFVQERSRPEIEVDIEIDFVLPTNTSCSKCQLFAKSNALVAHAHYPAAPGAKSSEAKVAGDIHLNGLIDWSTDESIQGMDLLSVALHEIGHSLGLGHSPVKATKMYPMMNSSKQSLHPFDVIGAQQIYLKRAPDEPPRVASSTSTPRPEATSGGEKKAPPAQELCPEEACKLGEESGFYPGPKCYQFYDCRTDKARLMNCPKELVWNELKSYCDFSKNVQSQCERD